MGYSYPCVTENGLINFDPSISNRQFVSSTFSGFVNSTVRMTSEPVTSEFTSRSGTRRRMSSLFVTVWLVSCET